MGKPKEPEITHKTQLEAWRQIMGPVIGQVMRSPWDAPVPSDDGKRISGPLAAFMDAEDLIRDGGMLDDDFLIMLGLAKDTACEGSAVSVVYRMLMTLGERIALRAGE